MGKKNNSIDISADEQMKIMMEIATGTLGKSEHHETDESSDETNEVTETVTTEAPVYEPRKPKHNNGPSLFGLEKKSNKKKKKCPKKYRGIQEVMYASDENISAFSDPDDIMDISDYNSSKAENIAGKIIQSMMADNDDEPYDDDIAIAATDAICHAIEHQFNENSGYDEAKKPEQEFESLLQVKPFGSDFMLIAKPTYVYGDEPIIDKMVSDIVVRCVNTISYYVTREVTSDDVTNEYIGMLMNNILSAIKFTNKKYTESKSAPEPAVQKRKEYEAPIIEEVKEEEEDNHVKVFGEAIKIPQEVKDAISSQKVEVDVVIPE